jgi:NADPH-dependent glutamate synthase beta subunit-like oxidoreductase
MCQEVRGVGAIGLINRGIDTFVGTTKDAKLKEAGCKFCRACVEVCPSGALVDKEKNQGKTREEKLIPCKHGCPAKTDIPRYVRYIAEGRYQDSLAVIRSKFPFPYSLGLVCNHPCEDECSRTEVNEPISIRELKRFVAKNDDGSWKEKLKIAKPTGKKVAIVGAGPSGLTAAWFLKLKGHDVTVFEMLDKPGGMLKAGIPDYRLPPNVLESEIKEIENIGVNIKCNTKIGSTDELFKKGFNSVYLAMGAPEGWSMGIKGEDDPRVLDGIKTLRQINFGKDVDLNGDIGVVGGGNVAVDIARSSLRKGAKSVKIIYRRTKKEMPAYAHEVEDALDEGVEMLFLTNPIRIIKDKDKLKVECIKMELGKPDSSGRRRPIPIEGSEFILELDRLIFGIGQSCDAAGFGVELNKKGRVVAEDETQETSKKGVYAGGDLVTGPQTVIWAVQGGRLAAKSIDRYLGGDGIIDQQLYPNDEADPYIGRDEGFTDRKRAEITKIPVKERVPGFKQVELCLCGEDAKKEAQRCLKCQLRLQIDRPPLPPEKKKKD